MKLIGFLAKKRLILWFYEPGKPGLTLLNVFFLLVTILYAFGFAALLRLPAFTATRRTILSDAMLIFACAAILVRRLFPVNIPAVAVIPTYMPAGRFKKGLSLVIYEGLIRMFLYGLFFYTTVFPFSHPP